ncbi:MAG TPA: hypothetical protein VJX29_03550 [Candidatus Acidoferrales bacterium]|nr:hypothetical protein [Candidatus Acidoferrales bacterium]
MNAAFRVRRLNSHAAIPLLAALAVLSVTVLMPARAQEPPGVPAQKEAAPPTAPGLAKTAASPLPGIREEVIGQITPGNELDTAASVAGHLVWVEKMGDYRIVFFDGKQQGGEYVHVSSLVISADGRHCAFVGELSARQFVVVDGQRQPGDYTRIADPQIGPEAGSFAYTGCFGERCRLVVNGKELGPAYQDIQTPFFTAGHEHYFYLGQQNDKWVLVRDGEEEGPKWEDSGGLWVSPDGRHTALAARIKRKWVWIVDGAPGPAFPAISPLGIAESGEHYVYAGVEVRNKGSLLASTVVDGKITASYQGVLGWLYLNQGVPGSVSPLSLGAAAAAAVARAKLHAPYGFFEQRFGPSSSGSGGELGLGVHTLLAKFDGVSNPIIAGAAKAVYAAKRGDKDFAVFVDGIPGPGFEDVSTSIAASPDGKHIAYAGLRGGAFAEVIDQQIGRSFPREDSAEYVGEVVLSGDATHLGYEIIGAGVHQRAKRRMVVDGRGGAVYDAFGFRGFQFSSDGQHHAYAVSGAHGDRDLVIFDGLESPLYDTVVAGSLSFIGNRAIRFIAQKGRTWVRVSESLE